VTQVVTAPKPPSRILEAVYEIFRAVADAALLAQGWRTATSKPLPALAAHRGRVAGRTDA